MTAFGGVERLILNLSRHLHANGLEHTILTYSNSADIGRNADWPVRIVELAGPRNTISEMRRLRKWIISNSIDSSKILVFDLRGAFYAESISRGFVVHLTDPPSMLSEDTSKFAFSFRRRPDLTHSPSIGKRIRAEVIHQINSRAVRKSARVIAMTNRIALEISEIYGVEPVLIRPGIEPPPSSRKTPKMSDHLRILSISRLVPSKRVEWILDAAAALENSNWDLTIVGDGPSKDSLVAHAHRLGISDRIEWTGTISEEMLEAAYDDANIFLMPAAQGWGLPAMEAIARGVPVVMHDASGVAEILSGSPWVEIASGDDSSDFTAATMRLISRQKELADAKPPALPTAQQWAEQICQACNWIDHRGSEKIHA